MKLLCLWALVVSLSFFVACSNDDGDSSEETSRFFEIDTTWHNSSQTEFVITTAEALAGLAKLVNDGNSFVGKTIKLGANIMLNDTTDWQNWENSPPAKKWISIGMDSYHAADGEHPRKWFNGTFDGNNYVISGIYGEGFFNNSQGIINNVGVIASYIKGSAYTGGLVGDNRGIINNSYFIGTVNSGEYSGGLVGQNWDGEINDSYSAGKVIGRGALGGLVGTNHGAINSSYSTSAVIGKNYIGGLTGTNDTPGGSDDCHIISDSYSTGTVTGESIVGGFVGDNNFCTIVNSYSTGTVTGKNEVGGFVGNNESGTISYSYSTGVVTGESEVGGFAGYNGWATINQSYSTGTVTGESNVGGLVGSNEQSGMVSNSYSTSSVNGENSIGGLVGNNKWGIIDSSYSIGMVAGKSYVGGFVGINTVILYDEVFYGEINNSYYNKETSGQDFSVGSGGSLNSPFAYGKTAAEMKQKTTFDGWDFYNIWDINNKSNDGYPYLLNTDFD